MLSDDILKCVTGLATAMVGMSRKMLGMKKNNPGSHTFQPVNIVTEAVSAKMSKFLFLMGGNTNRWKQQVGLQAQPEGPVLN